MIEEINGTLKVTIGIIDNKEISNRILLWIMDKNLRR